MSSNYTTYLLAILLIILTINGLDGIDKYRIYSIQKSDPFSLNLMLRCPLAWSEDDPITFSAQINNNDLPLHNLKDIKDSFVVDLSQDNSIISYRCNVTHKSDGSKESVMFYIDKENKFREIQRLNYSWTNTDILNGNLNEPISIECKNTNVNENIIWFTPDLLQLNHSENILSIKSVKQSDFGSYFCGKESNLIGNVLLAKRIIVKPASITYNQLTRKNVLTTNFPTNPLGENLLYTSNRGFSVTRRVIWEQPIGSVMLNQGRHFYIYLFKPEFTKEEYFNEVTDRSDSTFQYSNKVLFHSTEMANKRFSVNIYPNNVSVFEESPIELTCNNTYHYDILWSFKSSKSDEIGELPNGIIIQQNSLNSTLKINSSQPHNAGTYYCDSKKEIAQAVLYVTPKPTLVVSPTEIIVRPGSSARFLCQLIGTTGTVIWRREDKKSFQVDVESRIGGDTQALLVVSSVTKDMNGSVYECLHDNLLTKALLIVKDICPGKQRSCRNGICIEETRFCNNIVDCEDGSDEETETCAQCEPNQLACGIVRNQKPNQKCIANHWLCDGDNDCGNSFDELNCIKIDKNTCLSSHYACKDNVTLIPRSTWCDESINCPNGEDEQNCKDPEVVTPSQETTYVVHANSSISLVCEVVSVPTATINWRFNWGRLPQRLNFTVQQTGTDCNRIKNTLTIDNMHPDFAGVYTCEAVSTKRAMAKDYTIFVTSQTLCKKPFFNNAAMFISMCLKCHCSGHTEDCTSALGYYQSPVPKTSRRTKGLLMNYKSQKILEISFSKSIYDVSTQSYKFEGKMFSDFVVDPAIYLASDFGIGGSWTESYSYFIKINMKLTGENKDDIRGPKIILQNVNGRSLYWCSNDNSDVIYSSPNGSMNQLKISLWEKENWFIDGYCQKSATRSDILNILSDIKYLLIRIKYYTNQTGFEFFNATVEHVITTPESLQSNIYAPRIEKCNCPLPYTGLSCEKCITGYEKNKEDKCVRKCPTNCLECDAHGICNRCSGQRSGPNCLECKMGFVRYYGEKLSSDCTECNCGSKLNNTLVSNNCMRDLTGKGAVVCKCTGKEINNPECDKCLQTPLSIVNDRDCQARNRSENKNCNSVGTENIIDGKCQCKENFKGPNCFECNPGYFAYQNKCLKCFCSNKTQDCKSSNEYRFVNLTLSSEEFNLTPVFTDRTLSGMYELENSKDLLVNRSDNTIVVKSNPNEKGLVYLSLKLSNSSFPDDIHKYTMLYGGKISFQFQYTTERLKDLVYSDVTPFIEIESKKLGRLWSVLSYNSDTNSMESVLMEDYIPNWRIGKEGKPLIDRETFIRALMTAQYISIGFPFDNELVEKVTLRNLLIEHARWKNEFGRIAPVEMCPCPGNSAGFKCEACNKIGFQNVMNVSPNLPDFICGQCETPDCMDCKEGTYKYDFILNKNFSTCQIGIEMITKGRIINVNKDENLNIPCIAKSHRGGIAIHRWNKVSETSQLNVTHEMKEDKTSNVILNFKKIQLSDTGPYICEAVNAISNSSEEFFIIVEDKPPRLTAEISVETINDMKTQVNVTVDSPEKPTDYKVIWFVVKDGEKNKETSSKISVVAENKMYKIDIEVPANVTAGVKLRGVITGNRVENPLRLILDQSIRRKIKKPKNMTVSVDKPILELNFTEPGRVKVLINPNLRTETFWYKVDDSGNDKDLPKGVSKDTNDLLIWSAADNHNGRYVGYVINVDNGTRVGKVETTVKVAPMLPIINKDLLNTTEAKNASIILYVPDQIKCPKQTWEIINPNKTSLDITHLVKRISDKEITIDHVIVIGDTIRFKCSVIPEIDMKGKIEINIDSKFPVIEIVKKFENSVYPVSMECRDNNIAYPSNVVWYYKDQPVDPSFIVTKNSSATINWKILGGFSLGLHGGVYECRVNNSFNSMSKSTTVPDPTTSQSRNSKFPGSINISSTTNPIFKQKQAMSIFVTKNQRLEITAELIGNPSNNSELQWTVNGKSIEPTTKTKYYSKIEIPQVKDTSQLGIYEVKVTLENGTKISQKIEVTFPKETSFYLKVDGINSVGNMTILEGDTQSIRCILIKSDKGEESEIVNANIEWRIKTSMGREIPLNDLPGLTKQTNSKELQISKANRTLNSFIGQCITKYENITYESRFIFFDVNQRTTDMKVRLLGLVDNKYIVNEEEATSQVICQAYDARSSRVLPGVKYSWIMTNKENLLNWKILVEENDKITFGGLVYQPFNVSSVGICKADYYNTVLFSEQFTFKVMKKDRSELPKLTINAIFDPTKKLYPVAVIIQDSRPNSMSNITFTVTNKNFDNRTIVSKPGLLILNFTAVSTHFNPFTDSGTYTFTATNKFGQDSKTVMLPNYNNTNEGYPAEVSIFATSPVINDKVRFEDKRKAKIICAYYGNPYPISLKWIQTSENTELFNGVEIESTDYWTSLTFEKFDRKKNSGTYKCEALSHQGILSKNVHVEGYGFGVDIQILDENGKPLPDKINKKQGENIVLVYNATDLTNNTIYTKSPGIWEFRYVGSVDFSVIDNQKTKETIEINGNKLTIRDISVNKPVEIRLKIMNGTNEYVSKNVIIDVITDESLQPDLVFKIEYSKNNLFYPQKLICVDKTGVPSKVRILKETGYKNLAVNVSEYMKRNEITLEWVTYPFSPFYDQGIYKCIATNRYNSRDININLPERRELNLDDQLRFESRLNEIKIEKDQKMLTIINGSKLMVVCNYYGSQAPISDVEIFFQSKSGTILPVDKLANLSNSTQYYATLMIDNFDANTQSGNYFCRSRNATHTLNEILTVKGIFLGIVVTVKGLDTDNNLRLLLGSNKTLECIGRDAISNKESTNVNYNWILENSKGESIKKELLAEFVTINNGILIISNVKQNTDIRGRCEILLPGKKPYVSSYFEISTIEDDMKKPKIQFNYTTDNKTGIVNQIICVDASEESSNITVTYLSDPSNEVKVMKKKNKVELMLPINFENPLKFVGSYECKATSKFGTDVKIIDIKYIPKYKPLTVNIATKSGFLSIENGTKFIKADIGSVLEIDCSYEGGKEPIDAKWYFGKTLEMRHLPIGISSQNQKVFEKRSDILSIMIEYVKKHPKYFLKCEIRDSSGMIASEKINVMFVKPVVITNVTGLDQDTNFLPKQGSNRNLICSVKETNTNVDVTKNFKVKWYFVRQSNDKFPIKDLAENVVEDGGQLFFENIKPLKEVLSAQCRVTNGTINSESKSFFVVVDQDHMKKPNLFLKATFDERSSFVKELECFDRNQEPSSMTLSYVSGTLSGGNLKKGTNYIKYEFSKENKNPFQYDGIYQCNATNKYGTESVTLDTTIKPVSNPLVVMISSNDMEFTTQNMVYTAILEKDKSIEIDCSHSGGQRPVDITWYYRETELVKDESKDKINVYQKQENKLTVKIENPKQKLNISLKCVVKDANGILVYKIVNIRFVSSIMLYVHGLNPDDNFYPKKGSNDRKLVCGIKEIKSNIDISSNFKINWYFLTSNKDEYPTNELADKVVINNGEISFNGMKNPQKVLTAQCFATNGTNNYTSPLIIVDVNKAEQMPDGLTFYVRGLDGDFNFYPKEGSNDRKVKGSIIDKNGKDMSKDFKFKWYFLKSNKEEYPINELADKVVISDGEISFLGMKNPDQVLTAHSFATNGIQNYTSPKFSVNVFQNIDKRPKLHFNKTIGNKSDFPEKLFCSDERKNPTEIGISSINGKSIPKDWIKSGDNSVTVTFPVEQNFIYEYGGSYYCYAKNKFGSDNTTITIKSFEPLSVVVNSTINKITQENNGILNTVIRSNRKLQLDCYATGEPNVEIQWYIITEKYVPDVPVPSEKVLLVVGEKSQYVLQKITDKHYRVTREFYSKDNIDSLQCEAKLKGKPQIQRITIQEAKEIFKVDFTTEQGTSLRQQVFVDKPFRVSCEMKDKMKNVVKVKNFNWTFKGANNENIPLSKITGQKNNVNGELLLTNITLKYGSYIRGQCIAWYNDTYDVYSEEFTLNLQESPKIFNIYFNQNFPEQKMNLYPPYNLTYNSTKKTVIQCVANVSSNSVAKITWLKCSDAHCKNSVETTATPALLFSADATSYSDEGIYKCLVKLEVGGSEVLNQTVILNVLRTAPPRVFNKQELNLKQFTSLNLMCDSDGSPEGNMTWSFIPRGKTEEQNIPKQAELQNIENRTYQLKIKKPLKAEYDGIYICKIENQYGIGGMKYDVKIETKNKKLKF